jgi:hypothetical protein
MKETLLHSHNTPKQRWAIHVRGNVLQNEIGQVANQQEGHKYLPLPCLCQFKPVG